MIIDGINIKAMQLVKVENPELFRTNIVKKLNKIIRKKKLTVNLEKGIFNSAIKAAKERNVIKKWDNPYFVILYLNKFKTVYNNLNKNSLVGNDKLLKRLKKGEFKPHELAFMNHHQMYPEKWNKLITAKIEDSPNMKNELQNYLKELSSTIKTPAPVAPTGHNSVSNKFTDNFQSL